MMLNCEAVETQFKLEPTAGRAGRGAPTAPAMTPVLGEGFARAVNRGWGRSTVRPVASVTVTYR